MMKFLSLVFFVHTLIGFVLAKDPKYPVSAIPNELKNKMYAVIREKKIHHRIISKSNSTYTYRQVITILNAKGKDLAELNVSYDKMTSIKSITATVYNEQGLEIKKIKPSDLSDQSAFDGFSLYSDSRVKTVNLSQATYPYTVEVEYELQNKYLYTFPDFFLYRDDEVSSELIEYSITYPFELKPRVRSFKTGDPIVVKMDEKKEEMRWTFSNIIPDKFEPFSPFLYQIVPNISISPVDFEYGGYEGKMDSWQNFGLWQSQLNQGRSELSALTKKKVQELTMEATSNEGKARVLYDFLQNKTRYVSIQEGIGGLQPFPAILVDEVGYGDCKALSNYMVALLNEAGIKGYYTKIRAGKNEPDIKLDFPSHQTNHIVVAVPNGMDTLWLECTSQTNPFGYLGSFTGDRFALMVTEQGGKLVRTPFYSAEESTQIREAEVFIKATGDAMASVKTKYAGLQYESRDLDRVFNNMDEQKNWIQKDTQIPSFDIVSFSMSNRKDKIPVATVAMELKLSRFASVSGKRIFLTPNLMNRFTFIPEKLENRKTNVVRKTAYIDLDSIVYHLPENFYPEFLPESVKHNSPFGEYESSFSVSQGKVLYTRRLKMVKGEFPPETYNELIDFYKAINKADHVKIVFVNKT